MICLKLKCPACGGIHEMEVLPPAHTPQGPAYQGHSERCEYCDEPVDDDWPTVPDEADAKQEEAECEEDYRRLSDFNNYLSSALRGD